MLKIGITGINGFIGSHLKRWLLLKENKFEIINFNRDYFLDIKKMDSFVNKCDIIIHLAAINRNNDEEYLFEKNLSFTKDLVSSFERTNFNGQVIFSSSIQENKENVFGRVKKTCREHFENWSIKNNGKFTGLIIPNVFGPFGQPYYNSVVATFCDQLVKNKKPIIKLDAKLNLIYIDDLVSEIIKNLDKDSKFSLNIKYTNEFFVSEILKLLNSFSKTYLVNNEIPEFSSKFELNLFNTFRSYIDLKKHFPVNYINNEDTRGNFVELVRTSVGGQVSFSTTKPEITRGNHFHTRKIERFSVIKGEALIELRKFNSNNILKFKLSGKTPSFIDMPIWYTHNLKNIGNKELLTVFWINEPYNSKDPDTYLETV